MDKLEEFKKVLNDLQTQYQKRNSIYGDTFADSFSKFGINSALSRISEKFNVVCTIVKNREIKEKSSNIENCLFKLAMLSIQTLLEVRQRRLYHEQNESNDVASKKDTKEVPAKPIEDDSKFAIKLEGNCITCAHACREMPYRCELRNNGKKCMWTLKNSMKNVIDK